MRSLLNFLFVFFIFSTLTYVFSQDKKLLLKLSLEKEVYQLEELMVVRVKFVNNDTIMHKISHNCSLENEIVQAIYFMDGSGYSLRRKFRLDPYCIGGSVYIEPGNTFESFGAPFFTGRMLDFDSHFQAGSYSIFISGYYGNSDTVSFKIVYNQNNESYRKLLELRELKGNKEKIEGWREFLEDEENSIYANYAFDALVSLKKEDGKLPILTEKDIIYYFGINPDAWSTDVYLFWSSFYIQRIKEEAKMYEFLNKLINKYPDTRVSLIAKKIKYDKKIPDYMY